MCMARGARRVARGERELRELRVRVMEGRRTLHRGWQGSGGTVAEGLAPRRGCGAGSRDGVTSTHGTCLRSTTERAPCSPPVRACLARCPRGAECEEVTLANHDLGDKGATVVAKALKGNKIVKKL